MDTTFVPSKFLEGEPVGPLSPYIESYASLIRDQGYHPDTIHLQLRVIGRLDQWLCRSGHNIRGLNESVMEQFFRRGLKQRWYHSSHPATLRRLLTLLRRIGAIPLGEVAKPHSPAQSVVDDYRRHLLDQQALSEETVSSYGRCITEFILDRFGTGPVENPKESAAFIERICWTVVEVSDDNERSESLGRGLLQNKLKPFV
jgi:hypothetical protein